MDLVWLIMKNEIYRRLYIFLFANYFQYFLYRKLQQLKARGCIMHVKILIILEVDQRKFALSRHSNLSCKLSDGRNICIYIYMYILYFYLKYCVEISFKKCYQAIYSFKRFLCNVLYDILYNACKFIKWAK